MAPDERNGAPGAQAAPSPVLAVDDLHRLLDGQMAVTNVDGNLRVEIIRGRGRRNQVLWVPWEEAAHLLTLHGERAALLALDTSLVGLP